jgi:hypothetical protein
MMVLDLQCSKGHAFEGWFASREAFDKQRDQGEIQCPICEDTLIRQVLSAVAIKKHYEEPKAVPNAGKTQRKLQQFYQFIEQNFEEVGTDFAKEALKMHYGVNEKRNIRGTSTTDEEEVLKDEGVEFFKIPMPKEEQ